MGVREGGDMDEVEFPGIGGCGAGMMGIWKLIKLFCQLLWVLKSLHNKRFKKKCPYILLIVIIEMQMKTM